MKTFIKMAIISLFCGSFGFCDDPQDLSELPEPLRAAFFTGFEQQFFKVFVKTDTWTFKKEIPLWAAYTWGFYKTPCLSLLNDNWDRWKLVKKEDHRFDNKDATVFAFVANSFSSRQKVKIGNIHVSNCVIYNAYTKPGRPNRVAVAIATPRNAPLSDAFQIYFEEGTMCMCKADLVLDK